MISRKVIIGGIIVLALTSCKTLPEYKKPNPDRTALITSSKTPSVPKGDSTRLNEQVASKGSSQTTSLNKIYTPILKNVPSPSKEKLQKYEVAGDLSVELTKVDIKQAIKIILGDILKLNYVLHPNVRGLVTLRTVRPITKTQMLGLLDAVLEAHGLMAVHGDGIVQIIPSSSKKDAKVTHLLKQTKDGFGVEVIPLTNIPTGKMLKLLAPVVEKDDVIDLPGINNLLLISGIKKQRITIKKLIELLDVDAMASQYVAIVSLRNTRPEVMISELEQILSPRGNGLVRFTPIKRLNALMAITPNQKLIETVNLWIARLDKTKDADERRLFVYFVKHSDATALTETLKGVFASSAQHRRGILQDNDVKNKDTKSALSQTTLHPNFNSDHASNSILIWATGREYELISEVLNKVDISPLQVLIEGTVLEVTLQDNLRYGLKYLIESGNFRSLFTQSNAAIASSILPGFGVTFGGQNTTKLVIDALSEITDVRVVSSPQLLVMDGGTARLHVGDQVPIITRTSSSTATDDNRITNEIEYRDTGVTLDITPKVKSSGTVTLNISQTVSDVVRTSSSEINSPTIQQRQVTSTASLQSGTTALLAGLIREVATDIKSGIPLLHKLPVLGHFFGTTGEQKQRTELVVLISPKVIKSRDESEKITEDILQKYKGLLATNPALKANE
ncbi:MAG TPA: type II secretion system protein GspD [Opitutae bacterium]|nr:type II secretion system protein GspD [Opitutae bacterium]